MKSMKTNTSHSRSFLVWVAALALFLGGSAFAQQTTDPPGRVATLSHTEGSVAFAPTGETEWSDAVRNRPVTIGDRLWTDEGARAELHLGTAALHMDTHTFVDVTALDADMMQASLNEGTLVVRVRQLQPGEVFEIDTPNLALRAMQPGSFRIDVEPRLGFTRVAVRSGSAMLHGGSGRAVQLVAGQQMAFAGRDLAQATGVPLLVQDTFDVWAANRHRAEDQSIAARYVPRDVVGYHALDAHGSWAQDPEHGAIWFPRVSARDWAPYRYGRWDWIDPWGWTWIDDAPWGFAPFHYGRWAQVGQRWAWVPGALGPRPVYAPALVAFVGGLANGGNGTIGWYPLAPGEAWQPFFAASPLYVRNVNRHVLADRRWNGRPRDFHRRPEAITAVRVDDFGRGRSVHLHWRRMPPSEIGRAQAIVPPRIAGARPSQRPVQQPPVPPPVFPDRRIDEDRRPQVRPGQDPSGGNPGMRVWPSDRGAQEQRQQQPPPRLHQQQIQEQQRV
jgi:hypothetical protein